MSVDAQKYRPDIDGLRSVAVLPVVLFHFGIPPFGGGFVGVDVFFVISGYLITSIIARGIADGSFTVVGFYERRFRRILPALFAMVAATALAGWFILMPRDFADFGKSVAATALFASNFLFWHETDYFDAAIETKPLAHTWSLAVEEQFYIFFPLLLILLARGRRSMILPVLVLTAVSFALCVVGVLKSWSSAYYLLPFRAWELLGGSLLALARPTPPAGAVARNAIAAAGLAAILGAAMLLGAKSPFPGWNALYPVAGTLALIWIGGAAQPPAVSRLLAWRPLVVIGLISYSLYLWHWPVITLARQWYFGDVPPAAIPLLLVLTFALSWASWRFVERPFRTLRRFSRRWILSASGVAIAAASVAGAALIVGDGLPARFPGAVAVERRIAQQRAEDRQGVCVIAANGLAWPGPGRCMVTHGKGTRILLWGDSHAHHYVAALRGLDGQVGGAILVYGMTACPPIFGATSPTRPTCVANKEQLPRIIREHHIQRVLIAGFWHTHREWLQGPGAVSLAATVRRLRALGAEVKVLQDTPQFFFDSPAFLAGRVAGTARADAPILARVRSDSALDRIVEAAAGPGNYVRTRGPLCPEARCIALDGGEPTTVDGNHLSRYGARRVLLGLGPVLD